MSILNAVFLVLCIIIAAFLVIGGLFLLLYAIIVNVILKDFKMNDNESVQDISVKEEEEVHERIVYEAPVYID
jgi:hypothetical protein